MKRTGAWIAVKALEALGIRYTFGIPGVHNTELYDELNSSEQITPVLVTHEGGASFMADGVSRTSDQTGTLVIVPAAGATHAASGIGEAFLDGIPMLVICGGIRTDLDKKYQLHELDQHAFLKPLTKASFLVHQPRGDRAHPVQGLGDRPLG
jgi:acetolactate synthase-1/2/3 large subunit